MIHQRLVACGVRLAIRMVVDCRTQAVSAMAFGHAAELPEGFLNPGGECLERFGETQRNRLHVRVRQHAMKQRMIKPKPGDRHPKVIHHCEVAGRESSRMMHLLKHHRLSGARKASPFGHPPLECSPRGVGKLARVFLLEATKERLGLQPGFRFQAGLNFVPNVLKRVDTRAVIPRLFPLRRQPLVIAVIPSRFFIHDCHPCRGGERDALVEQSPQFQNLSVRDHHNLRESRKLP